MEVSSANGLGQRAPTPGAVLAGHCERCGAVFYPPRDFCPKCMNTRVSVTEADGRGWIYSFTEVRLGMSAAFRERAPYNIVLVETRSGLRILANIIGEKAENLEIGQAVEAVYAADVSGRTRLFFQRAES